MKRQFLETLSADEREKLLAMAKAANVEKRRGSHREVISARAPSGCRWPLSFAQQRMWFLTQMSDAAHLAYHVPGGLRLRGPLDVPALKAALDRIVTRHEVLRARFEAVDGQPVQHVKDGGGFAWEQQDLSHTVDAQAEIARYCRVEAETPFDLSTGPLVRGRLLRVGDEDHVLLLTMHHIVSDAWSLGVFARELGVLYRAYGLEGVSPELDPLPGLPIQYADYAAWQRRWLSGEVQRRQVDYWKAALSGAPGLLSLPADRPRPTLQDYSGASVRVRLEPELAAGLKELSRKQGATLFMTLLAGWGAALARLAGQNEVVVGSPVANRTRAEAEPLIGFFVNTLALRIDVSANPTVAELLQQVRRLTLEGQRNQDIPFDQVVEALNPQRTPAHSPIFQVMFAWQNTPHEALELGPLKLSSVPNEYRSSQFDLTLNLQEEAGSIVGNVQFASSLYDAATVERYVECWKSLLRGMVCDAEQSIACIDMLSEDERRLVLRQWNDTKQPYPRDVCLHELFELQAAQRPEAVAVEFEGERVSYRELNERANRLAHHLRGLGVGPDARVAVIMRRSVEMVAALLAVLKAGGAYVPLDPTYPRERLATMVRDAAPLALLTQVGARSEVDCILEDAQQSAESPANLPVLEVDGDSPGWLGGSAHNPQRGTSGLAPGHLAYVIYTSGSTGQPKGVMNEHRGIVNRLLWMQQEYGLGPDDAVLQKTPFAFDVSVWEFFWPLANGARLVIARPEGHKDPGYLARTIQEFRVTTVHFVPSMLQVFLDSGQAGRCRGLQRVVCSGEALSGALARHFRRCLPSARLYNLYGPTEAAVDVTSWPCDGEVDDLPDNVPIGRPVANTTVYLLDSFGQPVPVGVSGELHIGGIQVARGYLNRPELTHERFVPDPFADEPSARMYKTGDLARWLPDGTVQFLGRNDHQVKIRGFRIELGDIESQLGRVPGVREAVVLAREDAPGDKRLVAYVVGDLADVSTLRDTLARDVPEYMVPAAYVKLDVLPLTPNGKLDRSALPAPEDAAYGRRQYEAPRGPVESAIAEIWEDLLQVDRVGRQDHFFELGGHSLLAVRMTSRLRQRLGLEIARSELFSQPVLHAFASLVSQAGKSTLPSIAKEARPEVLPLSFGQQRLWFIAQMSDAASTAYHMLDARRLRGRLHVGALRAALDRVVERHEVLRTRFAMVDGQPVQRIDDHPQFALSIFDLRAVSDPQTEMAFHTRLEAETPFDLSQGPLVRGRLLQLAEDDHVLLITLHHVICDGWSLGVLAREFGALYRAYSGEGVAWNVDPLPPLPVQYADYALWQRRWLSGVTQQREVDYWKRQLEGAPALITLPTDRPRPSAQEYAGQSVSVELDRELTAGLKALSHKHGATLFMTLLAAWGALTARLAGQEEVVIGTAVANRTRAEVEPLIGFFVNTLALRVDLSDRPTVTELMAQVRRRALEAQSHQDVPFEQVVEALKPQRTLAYSPIFQIMFAWQNTPQEPLSLGNLGLSPVAGEYESAQFDLTLSLQEQGGGIVGSLGFATALYERSTIERFVGYWKALLRGMVQDDTQAVERIPILSAAEQSQVVSLWNRVEGPDEASECIHARFERQAARTPHAIAVEFEGRSLTYRELNENANRLAHHLMSLGVEPDDRVAIWVERSLDMVVGLLAVLKAGGGYVPLDPTYPRDRVGYMLRDSAPRVLLTQAELRGAAHALELPPDLTVVALDARDRPWEQCPMGNPDRAAMGLEPTHLAYVIYTSGSTGQPKGVMVEHANVTRLFAATQEWFDFGATDVWTLFHSFAFDFSVWEIWGALLHGGRLVVVPYVTTRVPRDFYALMCERGVTVLNQTPSAFRQLSEQTGPKPHSLRYVVFGGEALEVSSLAGWFKRRDAHSTELVNMYGITETTVHVTYYPLSKGDVSRRSDGSPIGRRIPDLRVYVLDAIGQPVPRGVVGELYVGGAGVARGYLNRPDLTRERFLPDPFAGEVGARMYKTGDLGRWLPDGSLEFWGRNDNQVKIRGFRIELGEIEAALGRVRGVREAVVVAREDGAGDKRLVAYVVGALPDLANLRETLGRDLPVHMLPAAYVLVDALPLTPNGKLDRGALPVPEDAAYAQRAYEAPEGPIETTIAKIWSELLHVERVSRHDHFFELGGHSLLAVQLMERMRREHLYVDIRTVFAEPTLAALAEAATRAESSPVREACVPPNGIPAGCTELSPEMLPLVKLDAAQLSHVVHGVPGGAPNIQDIYPLAPLQQGILFHHLLQAEGDDYLLSSSLSFPSRDLLDGFVRALQLVIARHDALRTSVVWEGLDEPVQVVWRKAEFEVEFLELGEKDVAVRLHGVASPKRYRMDMRRAPLLRGFAAFDPEQGCWRMVVLQHHLVTDHVTGYLLFQELAFIQAGRVNELPEPLPFRNFVAQGRLRATPEEHEAFFRTMLGDVDEPTAPFGMMDVQRAGEEVRAAHRFVGAALTHRIRRQCRALGVSAARLFHWAWGLVLAKTTGRDDVVFGTVLFGRMHGGAGADRAMGLFINTLPIRVRLGEVSVREGIRQTHDTLAQLVRHEHASLALAQRCSALPGDQPLFSAMLNYRQGGAEIDIEAMPGWEEGVEFLSQVQTNYPFDLSVDDLGQEFRLSAHIAQPIDAERICDYMIHALEGGVEALERAPETPAWRIDIMGASERSEVLQRSQQAPAPWPTDKCMHQMFEECASGRPNALAVEHDGRGLRYGELNEAANRLAHYLRSHCGVGAEDRVAICVPRGLDMVIAVLAVWKAGGAYVPLDPSYPRERLEYMLQDSAPKVLLTRSALHLTLAMPSEVVVLELDGANPPWAQQPTQNPDPAAVGVSPRNLAYVIYTSGSTGHPKGVMIEHRALGSQISALRSHYKLGPSDRFLQFVALAFDVSAEEIFGGLLSGGTVVLRTDAWVASADQWCALCEEHQITIANLPTLFWQQLVQSPEVAMPRQLRQIIIGGDAVDATALARWWSRPGYRPSLSNAYGPTETTINACIVDCGPADHPRSIGRPIANTRVYLLDGHGTPVPDGVAGEIHIGGAHVARGYLNRPSLTKQRFVADPFVEDSEALMYKTGDLGRWLPDGSIEFLGRNDQQVKIRGFRVEPGEIERCLRRIAGVREVMVFACEEMPGDKRLVAYLLSSEPESRPDVAALRESVARELPDYMVPTAYVFLDAWPLLPNGKLNRRALPAPDRSGEVPGALEAPEGLVEAALSKMWAEILRVTRVGRNDHFFELGGHSILAVQMISRLRHQLGLQASLADLFAEPVLHAFAARVSRNGVSALPAIVRGARPDDIPLSFAQQRLWFLAQMGEAASAAYHMLAGLRLSGPLDAVALKVALDRIVQRHEALRTRFEEAPSESGVGSQVKPCNESRVAAHSPGSAKTFGQRPTPRLQSRRGAGSRLPLRSTCREGPSFEDGSSGRMTTSMCSC